MDGATLATAYMTILEGEEYPCADFNEVVEDAIGEAFDGLYGDDLIIRDPDGNDILEKVRDAALDRFFDGAPDDSETAPEFVRDHKDFDYCAAEWAQHCRDERAYKRGRGNLGY